jgi:glycosyltransferase involved in cell wall biosynthesis
MTETSTGPPAPYSVERRRTVLILTPATRFGSWAWLEKVIAAAHGEFSWVVVSYGRPDYEIEGVRFVTLPDLVDYPRLARLLSHRLLLWLNGLFILPLAVLAWGCMARFRARVVIANGVASAAFTAPLRPLGVRTLLAFHGTVGHAPEPIRRLLSASLSMCDAAFVNSLGSRDDLGLVYPVARIRIVPLWADDRFFHVPLSRSAGRLFTVLFVGRQDTEKFGQCLRVCSMLAAEGILRLLAVGEGPLASRVSGSNLVQLGYLSSIDRLAEAYGSADVVWAAADVTYVAIPGVEGLASGCPLIVGDVPAVDVKARSGSRVPRDLVRPPLGVVVDGEEDGEAVTVLRAWAATGVEISQRERCREHARSFHSARNLQVVVDAVRGGTRAEMACDV